MTSQNKNKDTKLTSLDWRAIKGPLVSVLLITSVTLASYMYKTIATLFSILTLNFDISQIFYRCSKFTKLVILGNLEKYQHPDYFTEFVLHNISLPLRNS